MASVKELKQEAEELRRWASESKDSDAAVCLALEAASLMWAASVQKRAELDGKEFFDYKHEWIPAQKRAILAYRRACDRSRRKSGDLEIVERLREIEGLDRPGTYKVTPARRKILVAVVDTTSNSGRLYCSYSSLARIAGVSARTACTVRSELEALGVLERVRTGGKAVDGACQSNKYTVKWNALRDVLGIENRWDSKYPADTSSFTRVNRGRRGLNVFFSYEGFAHYSKSERQKRRLAKRSRDREATRRIHAEKNAIPIVENYENRRVNNAFQQKDSLFEQDFCAVTKLLNQNKPNPVQPVISSLLLQDQKQTYNNPYPNNSQSQPDTYSGFDMASPQFVIPKDLKTQLDRIPPKQASLILNEAYSATTTNTHKLDAQFLFENYLTAILDAENSNDTKIKRPRLSAATRRGSEKMICLPLP